MHPGQRLAGRDRFRVFVPHQGVGARKRGGRAGCGTKRRIAVACPPVTEQDVVAVEVVRGEVVESVHRARAAVTFPDGTSWTLGDANLPTYPRSSLKPFQAIAMCLVGLDVTGPELAVSAASHMGEPFHLTAVRSVLAGAGLTESDLQNTPDLPISSSAREAWIREGRGPEPIAQNCSGKHAAMLRTCVRAGWDTASYLDADHPLQRVVRETLAEYTAEPMSDPSVDGCGAPAFATSLVGLARGFGALAAATEGPAKEIADAYRAYPEYVSGTGHPDLAIHRAVRGLVGKGGAEGVFAVGLPDGTGIALKIVDGSQRGRPELMVALLRRLGVQNVALDALATSPVLGHGRPVGEVRVVAGLL
ncbi:MAG: asparaginase [Actinobacteria bacterium]|nr:asparaginase [Actinomycetota bacterium]